MLRSDLSGAMIGEDEIDDLAADYGVSAFVVRHQIENHRIARVSIRPDVRSFRRRAETARVLWLPSPRYWSPSAGFLRGRLPTRGNRGLRALSLTTS